jgi:hypothetical protein
LFGNESACHWSWRTGYGLEDTARKLSRIGALQSAVLNPGILHNALIHVDSV